MTEQNIKEILEKNLVMRIDMAHKDKGTIRLDMNDAIIEILKLHDSIVNDLSRAQLLTPDEVQAIYEV